MRFWKKQSKEDLEIVRHGRKLEEAIDRMKEPLAFSGEDVEIARKVEEARGGSGKKATRAAMKRDHEVHLAAKSHKQKGFHSQRRVAKRKGNIRNRQEEITINRISRK